MEAKKTRRRELRQILASLTPEETASASQHIREFLRKEIARQKSVSIAAFAALPGEPDLLPLILSLAGVTWHLPKVNGDALGFFAVRGTDELQAGAFGIQEPNPKLCQPSEIEDLDLVLVPGLGFDPENGQRIGRGKGFYDRFLKKVRPEILRIGVGFECQCGPVPCEPHDIPLHGLITENGVRLAQEG